MSVDTLTANGGPLTLTAPSITGDGTFALASFAAMGGAPDEFTAVWRSGSAVAVSTFGLDGGLVATRELENGVQFMTPPFAASLTQGGVAVVYEAESGTGNNQILNDHLIILGPDGQPVANTVTLSPANESGFVNVTADLAGAHVTWIAELPDGEQPHFMQDYTAAGAPVAAPAAYTPYADTTLNGRTFQVFDNQAQLMDGSAAVTLPGEPAGHAVFDPVTAGLSDGKAAVAWTDSGSIYLAMYDAATHSISARQQLDWNVPAVDNLHLVTLPDGGIALSWVDRGVYKGEVFDGAGNGGGLLSLTGQFGGIDSHGELYTVGANSSGQAVVQIYAINGSSGGGGTTGQTFTSDDKGDVWAGTAGNDTFNLGRGGDYVTGNGGNDTYTFAQIPWAGGHITDFNVGDVLNLTGLMSTTADTGPNGFADGYLRLVNDPQGDAQVWARYATSDFATWWLVTTLDGVASSSLQTSGDVITVSSGSGGAVTTSSADYVAPANVTAITLTGSQQYIDASATTGVTITSDNTGNTLIGGSGDDVFHLGRGGDITTGGAGADTFAFAETPWNAGLITDFNGSQGDRIDVSGLLVRSGYAGSDPFADGYLKYTTDAQGNAQLWSDVHQPGNDGWWLVATLDGVSTSSLHYSGGLIT